MKYLIVAILCIAALLSGCGASLSPNNIYITEKGEIDWNGHDPVNKSEVERQLAKSPNKKQVYVETYKYLDSRDFHYSEKDARYRRSAKRIFDAFYENELAARHEYRGLQRVAGKLRRTELIEDCPYYLDVNHLTDSKIHKTSRFYIKLPEGVELGDAVNDAWYYGGRRGGSLADRIVHGFPVAFNGYITIEGNHLIFTLEPRIKARLRVNVLRPATEIGEIEVVE